jgi:hypothetical protein
VKKHIALFVGIAMLAIALPTFAAPFADVPFDHWAYESVSELADMGVVEGFPDGQYHGQQPMTRYEMAMLIARLINKLDQKYAAAGHTHPGGAGTPAVAPAGKDGANGAAGAAGTPGAAGKDGAAGAAGKDGAKGDKGDPGEVDYNRVKQIVADLTREFDEELGKIKGKVDDLDQRVSDLEARKQKVQIGGSLMYRTGADERVMPVPNGDLDWPADRFGYSHVAVDLNAELNDNLMGKISLWNIEGTMFAAGDTATLLVREAYVKSQTRWGELTLGRQPVRWGLGLMVDNQQQPQDLMRFRTGFGQNVGLELVYGEARNTSGNDPYAYAPAGIAVGDDEYFAARLDGQLAKKLDFGVNFLADGLGTEKYYGADVGFDIWGRRVTAEWAKMDQVATAGNPTADANAFTVQAEVWNSPNFKVKVGYTDTDQNLSNAAFGDDWAAPAASIAAPFVRFGTTEFWSDRPSGYGAFLGGAGMLLQNVWDVNVTWNAMGKYPVDIQYYGGEAPLGTGGSRGAGEVWSIAHTRQIADGVDVELKWAHLEGNGTMAFPDDNMFRLTTMVGF